MDILASYFNATQSAGIAVSRQNSHFQSISYISLCFVLDYLIIRTRFGVILFSFKFTDLLVNS